MIIFSMKLICNAYTFTRKKFLQNYNFLDILLLSDAGGKAYKIS